MKEPADRPMSTQEAIQRVRMPSAPVPRGSASVRAVQTDEAFDDLAPAWNDLLERSEATVFQTYEWQRTWWKYYGGGKKLLILLVELDGELAGIAPMFLGRERLLGIPVATRLQFIGVGISDYLSVIAAAGRVEAVLAAIVTWLADHQRAWDVVDLEDVAETDDVCRLIPGILEARGWRVYRYQGTVCPRIGLPSSEEGLMEQLGPSSSYNMKRKQKRLRNNFTSAVRLVSRPEDPIDRAIDDFAVIHGGRWKSLGHPSAFDDPHHRAFHAEVCRKLAARDWLRLFFLDVGGKPMAVSFSFNFRSTIYMYQSNAHGPDEVMRCSPGLLIRSAAMVHGIGEGMKVFDFMRGDEAYKYREWDAVNVKNWLIRSRSPRRAGTLRFVLFLGTEFVGKVVQRLRLEYYDYRRYRIGDQADSITPPEYALGKCRQLVNLSIAFVSRHLSSNRTSRKDP